MQGPVEQPVVSVALCTYNGAKYLRELLDSLFAQTFQDFEIVASDDGSTDDTVAILREFEARTGRIRMTVTVNETNLGFARNFENALLACRGRFIAPCDQDDIWHVDKLRLLLAAISDKPMVYADSELIDSAGNRLGQRISDYRRMTSTDDPAVFAMCNCVSGHAMLFRRELLSRALPIPSGLFHDWWLAAVAASRGGVDYYPHPLVFYRQHAAAVTDLGNARELVRMPGRRIREWREVGLRIEALAKLPGPAQAFLERLSKLWRGREQQWFSFSLAWFVSRHVNRLHALERRSRLAQIRRAVKLTQGIRLKRLTNKRAYCLPDEC